MANCPQCGKSSSARSRRADKFCNRECYLVYRTSQPYSYHAIHTWLWRNHRQDKVGICRLCGVSPKTRTEWALRKDMQHGKDITRYIELCKPCHEAYDEKRHDLFRGRKHKEESKRQIAESVRRNRWKIT